MTIDAYVAELERSLSWAARRRALPEIKEHLRDSAARHRAAGASSFEAEEAATRDFGPAADVARRVDRELAVRETRLASVLALGAVLAFVVPLYVVPENTLPPAPWAELPTELLVLQRIAIAFWLFAGAFAAVSAVLAWTRWSSFISRTLGLAIASLTTSIVASAALVVRWFSYTPATPEWGLAAPLAASCLSACVLAALWTRSTRRRLAAAC
jgi:hypothetical protein